MKKGDVYKHVQFTNLIKSQIWKYNFTNLSYIQWMYTIDMDGSWKEKNFMFSDFLEID